jgi:hypothetical protein
VRFSPQEPVYVAALAVIGTMDNTIIIAKNTDKNFCVLRIKPSPIFYNSMVS